MLIARDSYGYLTLYEKGPNWPYDGPLCGRLYDNGITAYLPDRRCLRCIRVRRSDGKTSRMLMGIVEALCHEVVHLE
jgi:hypothetical protein